MKNRFLYIISLLIVVVITATILPGRPAQAHHYTYLAEDPYWQYDTPESPLTDNWVMWKWRNGESVKWYSDGAIYWDVLAAINQWYGMFSELLWECCTDEASADVRFYYYPFEEGSSDLGIMQPLSWVNRDPFGTPSYPENASYLELITVWIN